MKPTQTSLHFASTYHALTFQLHFGSHSSAHTVLYRTAATVHPHRLFFFSGFGKKECVCVDWYHSGVTINRYECRETRKRIEPPTETKPLHLSLSPSLSLSQNTAQATRDPPNQATRPTPRPSTTEAMLPARATALPCIIPVASLLLPLLGRLVPVLVVLDRVAVADPVAAVVDELLGSALVLAVTSAG